MSITDQINEILNQVGGSAETLPDNLISTKLNRIIEELGGECNSKLLSKQLDAIIEILNNTTKTETGTFLELNDCDGSNVLNAFRMNGSGSQSGSTTIYISGKNMFGGEYDALFPMFLPSGTNVVVSALGTNDNVSRISYYDKNQQLIDYWSISSAIEGSQRKYRLVEISADTYYMRFSENECTEMQVEMGETQSNYVIFNRQVVTLNNISFSSGEYMSKENGVWGKTDTSNVFTPFDEEIQTKMNALHTYNGTTIISNDKNNEMVVTYKNA